ncbi:endonuclease/exonuclease/phosphatase family protein [Persicobacter sp. CCB-QB2]|uniref:endonuclease/exonuclease/phosphatase family protein n=1 Tax=Persicobacter sp. CCB-QB2 TaxID=1561025 RepID=UPI0009E63C72|nr:endonuclease/exonuclease/phosphatase family protein [Persicobacter sp. CCB-QB2]
MLRILNIFLIITSLLIYGSIFIPPTLFWPAGILSYGIPVLMLCLLMNIAFQLILRHRIPFLSLGLLLFGVFVMPEIFQWNSVVTDQKRKSFEVLSYNSRLMREYKAEEAKGWVYSQEMINFIVEDTSAIKCLQEYYSDGRWKALNVSQKLKQKGYEPYVLNYHQFAENDEFARGMAIFSKFPILKGGKIDIGESSINQAIFADVLLSPKDTIRVYNLHLHSMGINPELEWQKASEAYPILLSKLKSGIQKRVIQTHPILAHIAQSPYPVLVCGDFNDPPFTYNYQQFRKNLHNAFEQKGRGFGFSMNSPMFFLRIDNQFYSDAFELNNFKTLREVPYSDHFPIKSTFRLSAP